MDQTFIRTMEWLERRVREAESRNPRLRPLKDAIAQAGREYDQATTDAGRRAALDAQDKACQALLEESLKREP